jgi:hypothetical protein
MPRLKVRFIINQGRHGAPLMKLGRISEQADKFLRALAADCEIDARPGEWLAVNFKDGSVEYDAEFQGELNPGAMEIFTRNLEHLADYDADSEGLNMSVRPGTALEYARIGSLIDPDETVGLGIYPVHGGRPKLRIISYSKAASLRREIETPLPSYGAVQGIMQTWYMGAREPNFVIRELSTDALVRVLYPAAMYSDVARAVQERTTMLMVSGHVLFDRASRTATEMRADRIDLMRMLSGQEFEEFFGSAPQFELANEMLDG